MKSSCPSVILTDRSTHTAYLSVAQSLASPSQLIVWEQNNSPGFGNGLPLILIRETLNKIYSQVLQCDSEWWGSNDPRVGPCVCGYIHFICVNIKDLGVVDCVKSIHSLSSQLCFTPSCLYLPSYHISRRFLSVFYNQSVALFLPVFACFFIPNLLPPSFSIFRSALALPSCTNIPMLD